MSLTVSPTQSNILAALGAFLTAVLPTVAADGTPFTVLTAQQNRAAEPAGTSFAVMTPINFERLSTNADGSADVRFTGSIAAAVLTVTAVGIGTVTAGATLVGPGVAPNTVIGTQIGGTPGGAGTYNVTPSQTVGSETLSAGAKTMMQDSLITVQIDFHSADTTGGDMAQIVSTALRDEFGVDFFGALAPPLNGVVPIHADNPRQAPFINAEQQYEWRWTVDCQLEVQQIVSVPQTYTDSVTVTPHFLP